MTLGSFARAPFWAITIAGVQLSGCGGGGGTPTSHDVINASTTPARRRTRSSRPPTCRLRRGGQDVAPPPIVPSPQRRAWRRPHHPMNDTGGGTDGGAPLNIGAPCTMDSECGATGVCATEMGFGLPGGYCTVAVRTCRTPTAARAPTAITIPAIMTAVCVKTCTAGTDCRMGYACAGSFLGGTPACGRQGLRARQSQRARRRCLHRRRQTARPTALASPRPPASRWANCIVSCDPDDRRLLRDRRRVHHRQPGGQLLREGLHPGHRLPDRLRLCSGLRAITTAATVCTPGNSMANLGDPCTTLADCAPGDGFCFDEASTGAPGGYCSGACTPTPTAAPHRRLLDRHAGSFLRREVHDGGTACARQGYTCANGFLGATSTTPVCAPGSANPVPIGQKCATGADCTAGLQLCLTQGFPGGYCTQLCNPTLAAGMTGCETGQLAPTAGCLASGGAMNPNRRHLPGRLPPSQPIPARHPRRQQRLRLHAHAVGATPDQYIHRPPPALLPFSPTAKIGDACTDTQDCTLGGFCIPDQTDPRPAWRAEFVNG